MNPYASYAATAVDIAGTEHIIWEDNGNLIHAIYDENAGTWSQAKVVSNAAAGDNLQLLAGNVIPYQESSEGRNDYAPGLIAVWEKGTGNARELFAVVGRYDAKGQVVWSNEVQLTDDGVADQGLDVALVQDGLIDLVYQKSLVLDPRDPQYATNPSELALDAAAPNRDDTDLYHTYLSVVLDENGSPSLQAFDGQTTALTFEEPKQATALYSPLGPGVQGISSAPSPLSVLTPADANSRGSNTELLGETSPPESTSLGATQGPSVKSYSFPVGVTRGFDIRFGGTNSFVYGRLPVPFFKPNVVLELIGDLQELSVYGDGGVHPALGADLKLSISGYGDGNTDKEFRDLDSDYFRTNSFENSKYKWQSENRKPLLYIGSWGVNTLNLDFSGQINYDNSGGLLGLQRAFEVEVGGFQAWQARIWKDSAISLIQGKIQLDIDTGLKVAFTFDDPKSGTKAPFSLNDISFSVANFGLDFGLPVGLSIANFIATGLAGAGIGSQYVTGAVAAVADIASNLPLIISAFDTTMPPWPWPTKDEYENFGWGLAIPIDFKVFGEVGVLNNTIKGIFIGTAGLEFELEVDPKLGFSIPWDAGIQVDAQVGAFRIGWGTSIQGTLVDTAPSSGSASAPESVDATSNDGGLVTIGYNPYSGSSNHYQSLVSQAVNNAEIQSLQTYQIGAVSLSNGGSNYLNGRTGSFQTYVASPSNNSEDNALINVYVTKGTITGLTVVEPGSGFGDAPVNLNFEDSGGSGATADVSVIITDTKSNTGRLGSVTVTNKGSGYLGGGSGTFVVSPTSAFLSLQQPLSPGLLSVTVTNGEITAIDVLSAGSGYTPGQVEVDFSQNGGGGTGAQAQAEPINTSLGNIVNDGPPSISSIIYTVNQSLVTATTMAWVADGVNDTTPLANAANNVSVTRVQAAVLSGTDWGAPESISNEGSTGFNFDPAIGYYLTPQGDIGRVIVWAHADANGINPNSSSTDITSALLDTDIYYAVATSGNAWSEPKLLTSNSGSDTKVVLGKGSSDSELVAAWVNTPLPNPTTGETTQTIYVATFDATTGQWSAASTLPNIGTATGKGVASLEVGQFQDSPAIFWSDTTAPSYAYSVLQESPALYYRLSSPSGATVAYNAATGGQSANAAYVGTFDFSQPGALLAANGGGDPNTSVGFTGEGYILAPGNDSQSTSGTFSVEFWVNAATLVAGQSLVDQGIYNANAVLPTATLDLTVVKKPTQDADGNWGYSYAVAILPTSAISITNRGSGLSPFNLDLTTLLPNTQLTLPDGTVVTLNSPPILDLNVDNGVLSSITVPEAAQILATTFVKDVSANGQQTTRTTLTEDLTFTQVPGWYIRTGDNNNIVFNAGGGEIATKTLDTNTWHYVVATYNSDASSQLASLYIDGKLVGQKTGSRFNPSSVPLVMGYNFNGKLDEVAYYNSLLTTNTNTATLDSLGQVSSLKLNSIGQITDHFSYRYNDPDSVENSTYYSVYDVNAGTWQTPTQFSAQSSPKTTQPILERSPVVDIVSNSPQLRPDGYPDSRVQLQLSPELVAPGVTITGIKITSVDGLNWTVGNAPEPGWTIGVTVDGELVNPLNPETDFAYTVMSANPTLDLYFQDSLLESVLLPGQTVNVTFYLETSSGESKPTRTITATIIPNPSSTVTQTTEAGKEQIAIGTILENEVTNLNQVDSGAILKVPNNAGTAVAAGNFKLSNAVGGNQANGIVVSQSSANGSTGAIWVLPAGSNDTLDNNNLSTLSPTEIPNNGVLITNTNNGQSSTSPSQIGNVLAVGDVDGDGYEDLIIGASQAHNANGDKSGNVYIISGKDITSNTAINLTDLSSISAVTLVGTAGSQAGYSLATGDVNGDGIIDMVVGAPYASDGNQQVGAVYLILGNSNFFGTSTVNLGSDNVLLTGTSGSYIDQYIQNTTWTSQVGFSVAVSRPKPTAPFDQLSLSVNGDGFADIIIGAPNYRQDVEFLGNGLNKDATVVQAEAFAPLLTTVADTGTGSPYTKNLQTGRAYMVFGSQTPTYRLSESSLNGSNGVILDGTPILTSDTQLGYAVSTGGDLNGDGFDDVVFGAPEGSDATGLSFVLAGQSKNQAFNQKYVLSREADLVLGGSSTFARLGKTLSSSGDLNGDGLADLVLGSPDSQYSTGEAYVVFGKDSLLSSSTIPIYQSLQSGASSGVMKLSGGIAGGLAAGSLFTGSNLNGPDSNGKTYDSLLVSAPFSSELYVVYGHEWLAADGNLKLTNLAGNNGLIIDGSDLSNSFAEEQVAGETDVSPALVSNDGTLYMAVKGYNNTDLYFSTSSNGGETWSPFTVAIAGATNVSPSLAVYKDVLYLAYTGLSPELNILYSTDGENWSQQSVIQELSNNAPTLVVYQDQLLLFYTDSTNSDIYYIYSSNPENPSDWSNPVPVTINGSGNQTSSTPVSVAVLDNKLYLLYQQGTTTSPTTGAYGLGIGTLNPNNPTDLSSITWDYKPITLEGGAVGNVGLTADSTQLYLTYRNQQDQIYVSTSTNGQDWRNPIEVPNQASGYAPSPALLNNELYLGYAGTNEDIYVTSTALPVWGNISGNPTQLLGDINGDGFADVLMGGENASLITFGKSTEALLDESVGTGDLIVTLKNGGFQDIFALGDFNGDGFQDTGIVDNNSHFYLLLGGSTLGTTGQLSLSPVSLSTAETFNFGAEVGDLNGDGFTDLILGFQSQESETINYNELYIAFGNANGTVNPQKLNIVANNTVEAAGDINGDGIDDLILGNSYLNEGAGAFYVLLGSPELTSEVSKDDSLSVLSYPGTPQLLIQSSSVLEWEGTQQVDVKANFNLDGTGNPGLSTVVFGDEIVSLWWSNTTSGDGYEMKFSRASVDSPNSWSQASSLPNNWGSEGTPDLITFNNNLYAYWYYSGNGASSTAIYYSQYQGNGQWGDLGYTNLTNNDLNISNGLGGGINLIEYNGALYAIWQGTQSVEGNSLYFSFSTDGQNWQAPTQIPSAAIFQGSNVPTLAVFQGTLYTYYAGVGGQGIYYSTYDKANNSWSNVQLISNLTANNNALTPYGLSIVNVEDKVLYAAWTIGNNPENGNTDNSIYISASTDGVNWDVPSAYPDIYGWGIPSLYLVSNQFNLLSPGANNKNTSTSDFLNSSSQNIISPLALGSTVATVGDVNGDGYGDAVIFAPNYIDPNSGTQGAGYLQFGGATGFNPTASVLLTGVNLPDAEISKAGDFNGDGLDDLLISSSAYGNELGITYVVFGASNLADLSSLDLGDLQPISTSSGQIVDGKLGKIQLSAGGSGYLSGGSGSFNILVTSPTSTEVGIIQATATNGVITAVKVTNPGAGFTSIANLQFNYGQGGNGTGAKVTVNSLVSLAGFQIVGLENSLSGQSLSGGGDVNGDGFDDIAIGAPGDDLSYILFGGDFTASVNQYGSIGDDTLEGTATGDVLNGQAGDDVLLGNGGLDVLLGGTGDDWLQVQDTNFRRVDGGTGNNILALYGYLNQAWDITTLAPGSRLQNINAIDVTNYGSNLLTINSVTVQQLSSSNILTVYGDSTDKINLSADFTKNGTQYAGGQNFSVYQAGSTQVWISQEIPSGNINNASNNQVPLTNSPAKVVTTIEATAPVSVSSEISTSFAGQPTQFHVSSPVASENSPALVFTVTRTGDLGQAAAARYRTLNDTAQAGSQYHAQTGYVTFAPGETTKEIRITLMDNENLGPRQRQLSLGLTPLTDAQAELLSQRQMTFNPQADSQLRNLETSSLEASLALSLESALPFESQNFKVSAPNGTTTLSLSVAGVNDLNTYFRWDDTSGRFEAFLFDGESGVEFLDTSLDGSIDTLKLHLVDGGRGDSDGVVNGVISGQSFTGQTTPGLVAQANGVFFVPTYSDGQVQFHNFTAYGDYEMGLIPIDDATGKIGSLQPGDVGYLEAALARKQSIFNQAPGSDPQALTSNQAKQALSNPQLLVQSEFEAVGSFVTQQLMGNQHYALYLTQNGQTQFSAGNPQFQANQDGRGLTQVNWGDSRFEIGTPLLVTPGSPGQQLQATFELARGGAYDNTLALYKVDNLTGELDLNRDGVMDLKPGDAGYSQAALERVQNSQTGLVLPRVEQIFSNRSTTVMLDGGALYGMVLIPNASVAELLAINPGNSANKLSYGFFSFGEVNPDGNSHVRRLGQDLWGFEDLLGGGDRDFNDMILKVDYSVLT